MCSTYVSINSVEKLHYLYKNTSSKNTVVKYCTVLVVQNGPFYRNVTSDVYSLFKLSHVLSFINST